MIKLPAIYSPLQKFGRLASMGSGDTNFDVWDGASAYSWLAAAATLTISSASTNDTSAGTGARTVRVYGLNSDYEEIIVDMTMNGQTGVTIGTDLIRVHRAYVLTVGTGGVNAGNIWIGSGTITAGVPANKYASISASMGQTLMAIYTIPIALPDGTKINGGQVVRWYATIGAAQSAYATVALQTRETGGSWRTRRANGIGEGGWFSEKLSFGINLGTKADVRIRVLVNGVNSTAISAGFDIALRQATST